MLDRIGGLILTGLSMVLTGMVVLWLLSGCSVNVVVAPNATLSVGSDLPHNAVQELEREYQ